MIKLAAVIAIACLATGAGAWFLPKKELDFDALNKHLVSSHPNDDNPSSNVAFLKSNVEKLKEPLKKTAELVIKLADSEKCNFPELEDLVRFNNQDLKLEGQKRIEKVLKPYLIKVKDLCIKFLDEKVDEIHTKTPAVEFTDEFWKHTVWDEGHFLRDTSRLEHFYSGRELLSLIRGLSRGDPEANLSAMDEITGKPAIAKRRAAATYALDKYVSKPCVVLQPRYNHLFPGFRAIVQITNNVYGNVQPRSIQFKHLIWAYNFCDLILNKYDDYERELVKAIV